MKYAPVLGFYLLLPFLSAEPVPVRHLQGFLHGFIVLRDLNGKILASGDGTQIPSGNRIIATVTLHFKDRSFYRETAVFSQLRTYQLLTYKLVQKGPSFKRQQTLSFDTSTGNVNILYTDKDGNAKTITDHISLPPNLANGLVQMLLGDVDPKPETTLSMLVATPKPRVVKLKISACGEDSFAVGLYRGKATHYVLKIDIGGVMGLAAKVTGKQPPPTDIWLSADTVPIFLKSEGQLYEDGPVWRIEMAAPSWPKTQK